MVTQHRRDVNAVATEAYLDWFPTVEMAFRHALYEPRSLQNGTENTKEEVTVYRIQLIGCFWVFSR